VPGRRVTTVTAYTGVPATASDDRPHRDSADFFDVRIVDVRIVDVRNCTFLRIVDSVRPAHGGGHERRFYRKVYTLRVRYL
jgi:hypothetical protein